MNLKPVLFSMCGILSFGTLQAETPTYQVGDKVEFLLTDPAHNMIKFRKDSSELDRSYALEWDVIDVDQAGKKMLLLARQGIYSGSYCTHEYSEEEPEGSECSFSGFAVLDGREGGSLKDMIDFDSWEGDSIIPYNEETDTLFFILNKQETEKYLPDTKDRLLYASQEADRNNAAELNNLKYGWWWLRSDRTGSRAPYVNSSGMISSEGTEAFHKGGLIRPAVWVSLDKFKAPKRNGGEIIRFGKAPQKAGSSEKTDLEWIVLYEDRAKGKKLLVTKYGIDYLPFNKGESYTAFDWKNSELRKYLNGDFIKNTFSSDEIKKIVKVKLGSNVELYGEEADETFSQDQVFLLTARDVMHFIPEHSLRNISVTGYVRQKIREGSPECAENQEKCAAADYAADNPVWILRERSNGIECYDGCSDMQNVQNGHLHTEYGPSANEPSVIRPAIWITSKK